MSRPNDLITFSCTLGFVFVAFSFVCVWAFAVWRTRLWFLSIMLLAAVCGLALSIVNLILYYDPPYIPRLLGRQLYAVFFYSFIWVQLSVVFLELIASVFLVRWILAAFYREKLPSGSNQSLRPTTARRE